MADRTEFPIDYQGPTVAQLNSALQTEDAGTFTDEYLSHLTVNDKIYADKQLTKTAFLPAPDGTFVNPWNSQVAD